MAEPTLPEGPGETYRFLWLRSFHDPIAVRVVCIEKACAVTGVRTDGKGGLRAGFCGRTEDPKSLIKCLSLSSASRRTVRSMLPTARNASNGPPGC
jgi:hypothetical protein